MKININCPCCKATNTLDPGFFLCRRCQEDLSLLYRIKAHSYKYRLQVIESLVNDTVAGDGTVAKIASPQEITQKRKEKLLFKSAYNLCK